MTPAPQEKTVPSGAIPEDLGSGERVVISGMSGAYPNSTSVKDLQDILYNKVNPVTTDNPRWNYNHPELPQPVGKIPKLMTFDAQFFKVHYRLGNNMDAMSRKLLEQTYQAIYDAGLSPEHLSGKKIGVYIGSCFSETEKACFYVASSRTGFGIAGCSKAMFANRISYWLNAKGPSMSIDAACSSGVVALERAYDAIQSGECEAAIVGGANLCLHPQSSVHYGRIMTLCMDGKTKSFDKDADGCARSEAVNVFLLQKAKDANRIYADVCYIRSKFAPLVTEESGQKYGPYRDSKVLANFINTCYEKANVSPSVVEYVEAFGSAVPDADKSELDAIDTVFCRNRKNPLLIGSVMSNIGYGEAASGISAVTKVCLGFHTGELAANLHCESPRSDVVALREGRMRVVTEHQPFHRSYAAVNSISVTGLNVHILLHGHYKPKDLTKYRSAIPYLVTVSGRQESAVQKILDDLKSRPIDPEEIALLHNIHEKSTTGHLGRGFTILGTNEENKTVSLCQKADYSDDGKRELWFVYSGMGSQWATMGTQLMRIPIFAAAIERCRRVLEPRGVDIVGILTSPDKTTFDNILHSFVGIAAVQIGLTDVLREMGIVPDKIIGHSVGELGCAYADGCFTAEEMILSAYSRGLVSVQTPFIHGSMAAVGLGYLQIAPMCPPEIEVACHNGPESSTISGPADIMKDFVAQLTAKGIFAREVPCSNIAYHSRYIKEAGPKLRQYLGEVIKSPKARSDRWLSTSVPQDRWNEEAAKYSSAEYHTNNLLSSVLFEETSRLIPSNAVLIEIAPHGLLQAILKRSLPASCTHIPLTRRGHADNAVFLLEAIGKLYIHGYNPNIKALYPKVEFPVSTGTPLLSHLVEWAHNESWTLPLYQKASRKVAAASNHIISVHDDEQSYLKGNVVGKKILYPFAGVLICVWDTLAMSVGAKRREVSVQFQNLNLCHQPELHEDELLRLSVQLQRGNGHFEVLVGNEKIMTGVIEIVAAAPPGIFNHEFQQDPNDLTLTSQDIYKVFENRGASYKDEFRSISDVNGSLTCATVPWHGNWVTLIDAMIQLNALRREHSELSVPRHIRKLHIDVLAHSTAKGSEENADVHFKAQVLELLNLTRCGGVVIEDIQFTDVPAQPDSVALKSLKFVPFYPSNNVDVHEALSVFLQMVSENVNKTTIEVVEIVDTTRNNNSFKDAIAYVAENIPGVKVDFTQINENQLKNGKTVIIADLLLVQNISNSDNMSEILFRVLPSDTFVLSVQSSGGDSPATSMWRAVGAAETELGRLMLARWRPTPAPPRSSALSVRSHEDIPLLRNIRETLAPDQRLIFISQYPPPQGLKDIVQEWRKESKQNKIYVAMINHNITKEQDFDRLPEFDLVFNILDHGTWGSEYFVKSDEVKPEKGQNVSLRSSTVGDLNSLHWVEVPEPKELSVTVHYAGLNVRDALRALGSTHFKYETEGDVGYGMDFSGVTDSGERVMGIVAGGAASSHIRADPSLLWPVPQQWSLEDAATVPLPYAQAFYCLGIKAPIIPSMRILVHGGAGALGQAVIAIALAIGCQVFTTVSDLRKKRFLMKLFPALPEDHIGNSRDRTFESMVFKLTNGAGCDVAISALKGELRNTTLNCLGNGGYLFDTSQCDLVETSSFGMFHLTRERNFIPIVFSNTITLSDKEELKTLRTMISDGIARGYVRPLSRVTYVADAAGAGAGRALRLLAASRHRGRALLQLKDLSPPAAPRLSVSPTGSQLVVVTADETLAIRLVDKLITRGATNLLIHAKPPTTLLQHRSRFWATGGVRVKIVSERLTEPSNVQSLVKDCNTMSPVEGVFVVSTGALEEASKAHISELLSNLDAVTRKLCPKIKYFSVISDDLNVDRTVSINRATAKLPSKIITLPELSKGLSTFTAMGLVEHALKMSDTQYHAKVLSRETSQDTLEKLASLADVSITPDTPGDKTLEDLGLLNTAVPTVADYLEQKLDVNSTIDDVPKFTVARLRELIAAKSSSDESTAKGLKTFFKYVDPDEIQATSDLVLMQTISHSAVMRVDEFDADETYLVMIPGFEGHYSKFRSLSERLKLPALVLQPGLDHPNETVTQMAERLAQVLMKRITLKNGFYLLGYSFGALVALEMAAVLERQGLVGTVFCVDATPDTFIDAMKTWLGGDDVERIQDALALHVYSLMAGSNSSALQLTQDLKLARSWREKMEVCVRTLRGHVPHSAQYTRSIFAGAYGRIEQALRYEPKILRETPLRSKLILLRSPAQISTSEVAAHRDLGLSQYTVQPPIVYDLNNDHAHALQDLRAATFVNRHLNDNIKEQFSNRNLCETYLVNADQFMCHSHDLEE